MTRTLKEEIATTISRFHFDQHGHLPGRIEVFLCDDLVVIRCHDVFTTTEHKLATTSEGKKLIQSARRDQRALTRREIERNVSRVVGVPVLRSFYDIDTRNGEQIEVYVLDRMEEEQA
ncbi:MAG TPA: DUF2294 domain-containing protein [Fimbriimonadaceae bacterium]|nr:DUF2294 domain-containing protein [Fimbriimonadaceae bacterium]